MKDTQIIDLYWARSENAISETATKYGKYCYTIAYNILYNEEDSEECVNDTWLKAWGIMPPQRPNRLAVFLGKITRNLSLDRYRHDAAKKRGSGQVHLALDELTECVPDTNTVEDMIDEMALVELLNNFLGSLNSENRKLFMRRYWYLSSIKEIADDYELSESKVKMSLLRSRNQLKSLLEKEGVCL
ncbi:MAG: sigma-70 family RNA polymerase sigma factor [Eubacterium sp.]|nr:sigma-70 family RNA polymerase sigma factor [Eubacterium sp.]